MAWVVDTSVVLDLITADPVHEAASTACLQSHLVDGLVVSPVTFVEIGPAFGGDAVKAGFFLRALGIVPLVSWDGDDTSVAHRLWYWHQLARRKGVSGKRPVADVLIAAFASKYQGLITRNARDFRNLVPGLNLVEP